MNNTGSEIRIAYDMAMTTVIKDTSEKYAGSQSLKLVNASGSKGSQQTIATTMATGLYRVTGYYKSTVGTRVYCGDGSVHETLPVVAV